MSHRWDCPDPWDARREGERAYESGYGRYSNPYDDPFTGCRDADDEWRRGYSAAEERAEEERAAEEAAERRRAEEAAYERERERAEWEAYMEEQQRAAYEASLQEPEPEEPAE